LSNKAGGKPQFRQLLNEPTHAAFLNGTLPKSQRSRAAVHTRFIALLKPPFKSSEDYLHVGWGKKPMNTRERFWGLEV
jgi:hypothetical protein